jgi:hypothetical protein
VSFEADELSPGEIYDGFLEARYEDHMFEAGGTVKYRKGLR